MIKAVRKQKYSRQLLLWKYTRLRKHLLIDTSWGVILFANWGTRLLSGICRIWSIVHHGFLMRDRVQPTLALRLTSDPPHIGFREYSFSFSSYIALCKAVVHHPFQRYCGSYVLLDLVHLFNKFIQYHHVIKFQPHESFVLKFV